MRTKIIIVLGPSDLGGAERQALYLAQYFKSKGERAIEVWCGDKEGIVRNYCEKNGIQFKVYSYKSTEISSLKIFLFIVQLLKFIFKVRKSKPDAIISYTTFPNILCSLTWRFTGAKIHIWQQRAEGSEKTDRLIEKIAIKMPSHFISNSAHGADYLMRVFGINRNNISIIHNGIPRGIHISTRHMFLFRQNKSMIFRKMDQFQYIRLCAQTDSDWRKKLDISNECFIAIMVANLREIKDHETLLRAWKMLAHDNELKNVPKKLIIAGRKETHANYLETLCSKLNIENETCFPGFIEDVSGILSIADLCVFSSLSEGLPNGILEAMAAGLPVVATDIPGIREAVGRQNYKYLSKPKDADGMYKNIKFFMQNKDMAKRAGLKNKQFVEKNFSLDKMCVETEKLIEKLQIS